MNREIHSTGSPDEVLGYDPHLYDPTNPTPLDMDQLLDMARDEEEQEWWCATEVPPDDLIAVLRRAS